MLYGPAVAFGVDAGFGFVVDARVVFGVDACVGCGVDAGVGFFVEAMPDRLIKLISASALLFLLVLVHGVL